MNPNTFLSLEIVKFICWLMIIFIYKNYHLTRKK